ncbi:hypothetical protein AVEN_116204-1 [Araneus ventricosus]|uniref:Uncharacterized protein n=1 Tax=Araneus ventricosus TaxID=182803 RepID=A0A4Y2X0M7_ARAVE|nr:hypothetical protein AVEN_116204-1 [Araneus ventricosus]
MIFEKGSICSVMCEAVGASWWSLKFSLSMRWDNWPGLLPLQVAGSSPVELSSLEYYPLSVQFRQVALFVDILSNLYDLLQFKIFPAVPFEVHPSCCDGTSINEKTVYNSQVCLSCTQVEKRMQPQRYICLENNQVSKL